MRGVKEDGEAIEELDFMPKLKKAFGDAGVAIEDQNGELRSTFDILNDLAGVWDTLSTKQKQYLGEKAAGNRQVKVLNAIMANWDVVEDTIEKANDSAGAAEEGNQKFMDSIEGRITRFQSAFSDLARTTIDSNVVKWFVDAGTNIANFTTELGGLTPVIIAFTGAMVALNSAKITTGLTAIGTAFKAALAGGSGFFAAATGWIGIALALVGAITAIANVIPGLEDIQNIAIEKGNTYSEEKEKLDQLNKSLSDVDRQISELESKGSLTIVEQGELDRLRSVSAELEKQKSLQQEITRIASKEARKSAAKAISATINQDADAPAGLFDLLGEEYITNNLDQYSRLSALSYGKSIEAMMAGLPKAKQKLKYSENALFGLSGDELISAQNEVEKNRKLVDELETEIVNYRSTLKSLVGDLERVKDPQTDYEIAVNEALDTIDLIDQTLFDSSAIGLSVDKQFDIIKKEYSKELRDFKSSIRDKDKIEFKDILEQNPDIVKTLQRWGWNDEDITEYINDYLFPKNALDTDNFEEYKATLSDVISQMFTGGSVNDKLSAYEKLTKAMEEQTKTGKVSAVLWNDLAQSNEDFAKVLELTAEGYRINTDAYYDYLEAQQQSDWAAAMEGLVDAQNRLNEAQAQGLDTSGLEQEVQSWSAIVLEIESATNALQRFRAAQQTPDEDQDFLTGQSAYKEITEGRKTGKVGTDQFSSAVDFMLGDGWEERTDEDGKKIYKTVDDAFKQAEKVGKRYFSDSEQNNLNNFTKDLRKAGYLDENNVFLDENALTGEAVTLENMAKSLGTSKEAMQSLVGLWNTYMFGNEKITFSEVVTDEEIEKLTGIQKLQEANATLEEIQEHKAEVQEQLSKTPEDEGLKTQLEQLEKAEETVQGVIDKLESGELSTEDTATLLEQIQQLADLRDELNSQDISIDVELTGDVDKLAALYEALTGKKLDLNGNSGVRGRPHNLVDPNADKDMSPDLRGRPHNLVDPNADKDMSPDLPKPKTDSNGKRIRPHNLIDNKNLVDAQKLEEDAINEAKREAEEVERTLKEVDKARATYTQTLMNRPVISSDKLRDVGWDVEPGGKATIFGAHEYLNSDKSAALMLTPILPNGDPLEPDTFYAAVDDVVQAGLGNFNNPSYQKEFADKYGFNLNDIILGTVDLTSVDSEHRDSVMDYLMQVLHEDQEELYKNVEPVDIPLEVEEPENVDMNVPPLDVEVEADASNAEKEVEEAIPDEKEIEIKTTQTTSPTPAPSPAPAPAPSSSQPKPQSTPKPSEQSGSIKLTVDTSEYDNLQLPPKDANANIHPDTSEVDNTTIADKDATVNYGTNTEEPDSYEPVNPTATVKYDKDSRIPDSYKPKDKKAEVEYTVDAKKIASWQPPVKKGTVEYTATGGGDHGGSGGSYAHGGSGGGYSNASGTKRAKSGISLVDDGNGPELIEHKKQGTFEIGDGGPRLTYLDEGDVVHTAEDTKKILKRLGNIGSFFRDGLNTAKAIIGGAFATGVSGGGTTRFNTTTTKKKKKKTTTTPAAKKTTSSSSKKSSSKKSSGSSGGGSKTTKVTKDAFSAWVAKLFDWAEIRLERLKDITENWLYNVSNAVGYIVKNSNLDSAIKSVTNEINASNKAYKLYIKQANKVAKKGGLSAAIVKKVKNGSISIGEYSEDVQKKITEYQKWYEKALKVKKEVQELKEQQKELAKQKLDNIIDYYDARINKLGDSNAFRESVIEYYKNAGIEIEEEHYRQSIDNTNSKIDELIAKRDALQEEFENVVSSGYIQEESLDWYEYKSAIDEADRAIIEARIDLIELQDAVNAISLQNLGWQLDELGNSANTMSSFMDLHSVQDIEEEAEAYADLIENGMQQINNLEEQNRLYRQQQQGLDVLSEKYQELQANIEANDQAIMQMKISQEEWNDAIVDLKIAGIEKLKESLQKTNEEYERQKKLQDALEELERARSQRTERVYVEGQGFVYQANQDAIKDAQEELESVIEDQLLDRLDDLIDALDNLKADTNVYDANGNLIGTQYTIPQIGTLSDLLSGYYNTQSLEPSFEDIKRSVYEQIISGANGGTSTNFSFGNINLSEVNDVDSLAQAIIEQLPNALLQALYRKS